MMKRLFACLAALCCLAVVAPARGGPRPTHDEAAFRADFARFARRALQTLPAVPGFGVAVVRDGHTVLADGYGYLDGAHTHRSSARAQYYIASSTKSFTALAALLMDRDGRIDLDRSVADSFPDVTFDPAVHAGKVPLRALLTHTSGMRNDAIDMRLAYTGDYTPTQLRALLRYTVPDPESKPGTFRYTNFGYNLVSFVMEDRARASWRTIVQRRVFAPLGLRDTTNFMSRAGDRLAPPHSALAPPPHRLSLVKNDATMHAAGGTLSSPRDMARWLRVQLGDGRIDGRQVFPADLVRASHRPLAKLDAEFADYHRVGYGYGWYVARYLGTTMIQHFGSYPGYRAHVSFLPRRQIGVAVLVNEDTYGYRLADLLADYAYEWWLRPDGVDARFAARLDALKANMGRMLAHVRQARRTRARRRWSLSLPPARYVGTYRSPALGTMRVEARKDGGLALRLGRLVSVAEPYAKPESVRVELVPNEGSVATFELADGRVGALRYEGYEFVRVAPAGAAARPGS